MLSYHFEILLAIAFIFLDFYLALETNFKYSRDALYRIISMLRILIPLILAYWFFVFFFNMHDIYIDIMNKWKNRVGKINDITKYDIPTIQKQLESQCPTNLPKQSSAHQSRSNSRETTPPPQIHSFSRLSRHINPRK